jgi:hypothetical protein
MPQPDNLDYDHERSRDRLECYCPARQLRQVCARLRPVDDRPEDHEFLPKPGTGSLRRAALRREGVENRSFGDGSGTGLAIIASIASNLVRRGIAFPRSHLEINA